MIDESTSEHECYMRTRKPRRILVIGEGDAETWDAWSGTSRSVVEHLRRRGHVVATEDVDLYGMSRLIGAGLAFSPDRYRWWVRYHLGGPAFNLRARRARRLWRRHAGKVDLVLQFGATFELPGPLGVPLLIYCDGNAKLAQSDDPGGHAEVLALTDREREALVEREARVYAAADHVMTLSGRLRNSFMGGFGLDASDVTTVFAGPNGDFVDTALGRHPHEPPIEVPPTILFVGRSFDRKGGDLLLEAFSHVRRAVPDARLVVVGPSDGVPQSPGVINLGLLRKDNPAESVRLAQAYAEADVFCLPTRYEPFGIALVEAMLFGLPCVATDAWAVPEIVVHGRTGLLVERESVEGVSAALIRLLSDPRTATQMGREGRARAMEQFTWPRVVARMEAVFDGVLGA